MGKKINYNFKNIQNDDEWNFFRENFTLDKNYIHLSLAIHVPHSNTLNIEIDKFRKMIDCNPDLMRRERHQYTNHTLDAAAKHLNTNKNLIALTDSSTMSLSLILNGLDFKNNDEILTTNSEHYSLEKLCEHNAERHNLKLTKINLKKCLEMNNKVEIAKYITSYINNNTSVVFISWVNSKYGIKMPLQEISKELQLINTTRAENKKILLCVDGVHGFGVENINSIHDLGVDFFAAGCHKWLFGPRGTGLLWGSERGWKRLKPTIPSFEKIAWDHYLEWNNQKAAEEELIKAKLCTPGGFKTFEYIWALRHAFEYQEKIGKQNIHERVHYLTKIAKKELEKSPNIIIHTPINDELSSGFVCFNINGINPTEIVNNLAKHNIIIGQTPYKESCARITPSIYNSEKEVIYSCEKINNFAHESI
ncbi:aminotransferase class V-fold PLP-dependent enzyme [Spirobacillus cienkowskii]|uniref:aminotransferase class V-fold PLP-dependent enzyme n=1 Tax=Spirobacillus cienkowskii TaxID=495820 RepID=UPI0030CC2852